MELLRLRRQKAGEPAVVAADLRLDAADEVVSLGLAEMACRLGAAGDFRGAADHLERLAQVKLSPEKIRELTLGEGDAVRAAEKAGTAPPLDWSAGECLVEGTAITRMYLGADGVKVPTVTEAEKRARRKKVRARRAKCGRKRRPLPRLGKGTDQRYKEAKLVVYYGQDRERRLVSAAIEDAAACGRRMRRDGRRIGLSKADDRLGVFDGADWILNQVRRQSLPLDACGLDFYHLAENVHKCRRAAFGDDDDRAGPGMTWAGEVLHAARHDGYDALWSRLADLRSSVRKSPRKRAAADQVMQYVAARKGMIDYPAWAEAGRDVGSGPTEAMCKAVTARLKGPGMRWDPANADAMMALTCLRLSDRWKSWWSYRLSA